MAASDLQPSCEQSIQMTYSPHHNENSLSPCIQSQEQNQAMARVDLRFEFQIFVTGTRAG